MDKEWSSTPINDVCNIEYGTRVVRRVDEGTKYPVYGGGGETFKIDEYNRENRMIISRFAMSETAVRFVSGKFFLNDSGLTLSPKNPSMITEEFLNYYLLSSNETIYHLGRGTAQKNLNMDEFKKLEICYPINIDVQKQIVAILDKAFTKLDEVKEILERQLVNANQLIESSVKEAFDNISQTSPLFKLKDVASVQTGPFGSQLHQSDYVSDGTPIITVEHLKNKRIEHENLPLVSDDDKERLSKYILKTGDLVFSRVGAVDRCSMTTDAEDGWLFSGRCLRIRADEKNLTSKFLSYYFEHPSFKKHIRIVSVHATMPSINTKIMEELDIPIPSLSIQKEIAEHLEILQSKIEDMKNIYSEKLLVIEELRKSILDKAFRGELLK